MCVNVCLIIFDLFNLWIDFDSYKVLFSLKDLSLLRKFVARDQKINDLKKFFFLKSTRETRRKMFVLHELDDFDKTQLAIEFAQKSQKIFSSIFWLNDDNKKSLRQSLAQIDRKLLKDQISNLCRRFFKTSSEELDEIISNILIWFDKLENNRWLLIFDNVDRDNSPEADDPQSYDVKKFFSEVNHDSILITSRLRQLRQHEQNRQFERMSDLQEAEVLRCRIERSIEDNETQATVLVRFTKQALYRSWQNRRESEKSFTCICSCKLVYSRNDYKCERLYSILWRDLRKASQQRNDATKRLFS